MSPTAELLVLLLTPGVPLLMAVALMVQSDSRTLKALAAWSALPALLTSWLMTPGIAATVPWILQGSEFGIDATGRIFLFFSASLWLVAGIAAKDWLAARESRFLINFLLVMCGSLGLIIARDVLAFYLFFSLMSFASYGLVVHDRSQRSRHAGRVYLTFVLAGDMMIFAALVLIIQEGGGELLFEAARAGIPNAANRHAAYGLLMAGFGVKVGVIGLHVTLPLIYQTAPIPAAVVLAGVLINAGLLGWLRLLPLGTGGATGWGLAFVIAGIAAAFYGAFMGMLQRRPRVVLAYSSISQMGIMTVGVGVALASLDPGGAMLTAVSIYALHHAFAKGALFLGWGIAGRAGGPARIWLALGLLLPALALTGAPLTTGMLAKEMLKEALPGGSAPWVPLVKALLPWMAFATTLVLARFLWLARRAVLQPASTGRGADGTVPPRPDPAADPGAPLTVRAVMVWAALVVLSLSAAWLMPRETELMLWNAGVLWEVSWPVLLGVAVSAPALVPRLRARLPALPEPPPGDVLVLMEMLASIGIRAWYALVRRQAPALRELAARPGRRVVAWPPWTRAADAAERLLVDWRVGTTLLVLVVLVIWVLLLSWG